MSHDRARVSQIAGLMLDGAAKATADVGEVVAACEYMMQTIEAMAMRGVVERAFGADSSIVTSMFGYRKSAGAHGVASSRDGSTPSTPTTTTKTEAPQTGGQPASTGLQE